MRIISGKLGGRRIQPPAHMPYTRPTTDIAKEGLFNIIQNKKDFEGLKVLDLFGGTGCISYEFASRGAGSLTIIEKDPKMFAFINATCKTLGIENASVHRTDVFRYLKDCQEQFDMIFAGPPYALAEIDQLPVLIFQQKCLREDGWFILEHTPRNDYKGTHHFFTERKYGTTLFSIFTNTAAP